MTERTQGRNRPVTAAIGVGARTVWWLIQIGELLSARVNRRRFVWADDLDCLVAEVTA